MVTLTKIYTRGGDGGKTSLGDGSRIAKHDPRVEAYGTVDEANAVIGLARLDAASPLDSALARIQNDLFDVGADLCRPGGGDDGKLRVRDSQVTRLENELDEMNDELAPLTSFVLPGGSPTAARLHLARTVVRRAERLVSALAQSETINGAALRYLNRLSDYLFVAARFANGRGTSDVLWQPGANQ